MSRTVEMQTSAGLLRIELDEERAPLSAANFVDYVKRGHYDGTIFHRVIKGFMIQGGGFDAQMRQKPVGEARTSAPHSATAQFFINTVDNGFLDFKSESPQGWGYAVFGRVVDGTDVVDRIEQVPTGQRGPHGDVPIEPVRIERAVVVE